MTQEERFFRFVVQEYTPTECLYVFKEYVMELCDIVPKIWIEETGKTEKLYSPEEVVRIVFKRNNWLLDYFKNNKHVVKHDLDTMYPTQYSHNLNYYFDSAQAKFGEKITFTL